MTEAGAQFLPHIRPGSLVSHVFPMILCALCDHNHRLEIHSSATLWLKSIGPCACPKSLPHRRAPCCNDAFSAVVPQHHLAAYLSTRSGKRPAPRPENAMTPVLNQIGETERSTGERPAQGIRRFHPGDV